MALAELYSDIIGAETRTHAACRARAQAEHREAAARGRVRDRLPGGLLRPRGRGCDRVATAFTVAKWSGLGLIGLYGYFGGRLSGRSVPASILHALAVGLIGGFLIAFKALLH